MSKRNGIPKAPAKTSENVQLTRPLIDALNQTGGYAVRMNSGKVKVARGYVQLNEEGTADILFFPRGIFNFRGMGRDFTQACQPVWIETKDGDARTKKSRAAKQAEFRVKVEALGHRYILAKTVDEGLAALR